MKRLILISLVSLFAGSAFAQDELLAELQQEDSAKVKQNITAATFKSTRIINMHSVEMTGVGNLQFMIIHHFGEIWSKQEGFSNVARLLGMNGNYAGTYLSFDYTPIRWMNLGIGFAGNSTIEGTAKFKILRQQTGEHNYPLSVVWVSTANFNASESAESPNDFYWNRFSYLHQLLIARKFSEKLSLQFIPSMVHRNIVAYGYDNAHNIFSLGIGGRYKFSAKQALTFEYSRQLNMYEGIDKTGEVVKYSPNLFSIGYDWDTGGHIFQFFFTNSAFASNIPQLTANPVKDSFGQWSFGFNLNRSYSIKKTVKTN
jgi:Membrane bound beta barrel domain (DUF5777)